MTTELGLQAVVTVEDLDADLVPPLWAQSPAAGAARGACTRCAAIEMAPLSAGRAAAASDVETTTGRMGRPANEQEGHQRQQGLDSPMRQQPGAAGRCRPRPYTRLGCDLPFYSARAPAECRTCGAFLRSRCSGEGECPDCVRRRRGARA